MGNIPPASTSCYTLLTPNINNGTQAYHCTRFVVPNAAFGTPEDKANKLVNYIIGPQTQQDLVDYVSGKNNPFQKVSGPPPNKNQYSYWMLLYPLLFPPVMEVVYSMNPNVPWNNNGGSQQLTAGQYYTIPNPFLAQARIIENLMLGTIAIQQQGAMPCSQQYYVPYTFQMQNGSAGVEYLILFENINNPSFNQCFTQMIQNLSNRQATSGLCIGGTVNNSFLQGFNYDYTKVYNYIYNTAVLGTEITNLPLQVQPLIQPGGASQNNALTAFFTQRAIGPYDTQTKQPCTDLGAATCTYQICQGAPPTGYNCSDNGLCIPQYGTQGQFATKEECEQCNANGTCPGNNRCCPESNDPNNPVACTAPNSPPTSNLNFTVQFIIALVAIIFIFFVIFYFLI